MGSTYTRVKNLSNEYRDYPPGCVPCPKGSTPGNPGTFEDIHKKIDELDPKNFDGARLVLNKILSNHFSVTHTVAMNSTIPMILDALNVKDDENDAYRFAASYTGAKKVGPREKYPLLYGDITPNGTLKAHFVHTLGCRTRIKHSAHVKRNKYTSVKTTLEYRSDDFTVSATLVDPKLLKAEGVVLLQYLQAVTSRITLGAEIACNRTTRIPGPGTSIGTNIAGAFRYSTGFRTLSATLGEAGIRVSYHHRQSQHLQIGVEVQNNLVTKEVKARLLYRVDVPVADVVFKGFVDSNFASNFRVGGVFEKKLYPIPEASLALSGLLDHRKQIVSVGIGLSIGQ